MSICSWIQGLGGVRGSDIGWGYMWWLLCLRKSSFTAQELVQNLDPEQPIATFEYTLREFSKNITIDSSNRTVVIITDTVS